MKKNIAIIVFITLVVTGVIFNFSSTLGYGAPQLCMDIDGQSFQVGDEFECAVEIGDDMLHSIRSGSQVAVQSDQFESGALDIVDYSAFDGGSWGEVMHEFNIVVLEKMWDTELYGDVDYIDFTFHVYEDVEFDVEFDINFEGTTRTSEWQNEYESGYKEIMVTESMGGGGLDCSMCPFSCPPGC